MVAQANSEVLVPYPGAMWHLGLDAIGSMFVVKAMKGFLNSRNDEELLAAETS